MDERIILILRHNKNSKIINALSITILILLVLFIVSAWTDGYHWSPAYDNSERATIRSICTPIIIISGIAMAICITVAFAFVHKNSTIEDSIGQTFATSPLKVQMIKHNKPLFIVSIVLSTLPAILTTVMSVVYVVSFFW